MIKRADASKIGREKATKEQIAENFKRLAVDSDKKVQLKPSILKIQKTLDGNTFGIIHENKTYYLKYTPKKGSTNPVDFKHLDGLNNSFGIEKFNSFDRAINKMSFICEAQNNAHKLRLLLEKDEDIIDGSETSEPSTDKKETKITSDKKEQDLISSLNKKETPPAADMGGDMAAAPEMGGEAPMDTQPKGETPAQMADEILPAIGDDGSAPAGDMAAAPEGEEPAADMGAAPEGEEPAADMGGDMGAAPEGEEPAAPEGEKSDPKKEFQEAVGKLGQIINELQDSEQLDVKDIKNVMNSVISAVGEEGFKLVGDKVVESFYKKMQGSQESVDNQKEPAEEAPAEEAPAEEEPIEEPSTEKLDENLLRQLKSESKRLLKEQLQQEIEKRKRKLLIETIKRKLI